MKQLLVICAIIAASLLAGFGVQPTGAAGYTSAQQDCPFNRGFTIGYQVGGSPSIIGACTTIPTPPPGGCPTLPPLNTLRGTEYPTNIVPYCQSPWSTPISANCQAGNCATSWSQTVVNNTWLNGNTCQGLCQETAGSSDANIFYATSSDPVVTLVCTAQSGFTFCPTGAEVAPTTIFIPAVARSGVFAYLGCSHDPNFPDATMQVWQPNGSDIEFGYLNPTCGSGPGGNWRTGDTISTNAIGNCGNLNNPGIGFFQTNVVASASGRCFSAGVLRANEMQQGLNGINHALSMTLLCFGSPGGVGQIAQYPATPSTTGSQQCTNGPLFGPPLGGRLRYKPTCATINGIAGLTISEKAILCAVHTYGAYPTDNFGGGPAGYGFGGFTTDSILMFFQYGLPSPYATLPDWQAYSPCPQTSSVTNTCYFLASHATVGGQEWNPFAGHVGNGPSDPLDPLAQMEWLQPCSAQGTC